LDEHGEECLPNETGEICIQGDIVFKGYFNQEEATRKILKNNWLHSGDYGKKDDNGFLYFCGLKKNMINVAGNNVYPKHVERLIQMFENVLSISVFGEPSILQGQTVRARITLHNNSRTKQDEIKTWCHQHINHNLVPKIWYFES